MSLQKINIDLDSKEMSAIVGLLVSLKEKMPWLVDVTGSEKHNGFIVGDDTLPFIKKALEYANKHPEIVPSFIDMERWNEKNEVFLHLRELWRTLGELFESVEDTQVVQGHEVSGYALAFYSAAQDAVKHNVSGSKSIVDDLGKRFTKSGISGNQVDPNLDSPATDMDATDTDAA
jgi:hypothetical protein